MAESHKIPSGAEFLVNWASQLLSEKGHAVDAPAIWTSDGRMRTPVNGLALTNEEIINKASKYQEWAGRKRLFLEYMNGYQDSLTTNAR